MTDAEKTENALAVSNSDKVCRKALEIEDAAETIYQDLRSLYGETDDLSRVRINLRKIIATSASIREVGS
jgi:hypothetical protein